jgi:hypothetical protein
MNTDTTPPAVLPSRRTATSRLVCFGLPGFLVWAYFTIGLFAALDSPKAVGIRWFVSFPLALVGLLMMLHGVGKWGQWGYSLVFLSFPASLVMFFWLSDPRSGGKLAPVVVAGVSAVFSYKVVEAFYQRGAANQAAHPHR